MESRVSPLLRPYLSLLILIPSSENDNMEEFRNMVHSVNTTTLEPEDFLSDNVYIYRRDTGQIEIA